MAYYPGATMRLLPEDKTQPMLTPTQLIFHTVVGERSPRSTFDRPGCGKESHLWVGRSEVEQYVTTSRTADAQWSGNHHAVSVESADNGDPQSDPWTGWQVEQLAQIAAWVNRVHSVPLRMCEAWDDPGIGYHRLFVEWNKSNHSCPGDARVKQVPQIIARAREIAAGAPDTPEDDDMKLDDILPRGAAAAKELGHDADTVEAALVLAARGGKAALKLAPAITRLAADVAVLREAVASGGGATVAQMEAAGEAGAKAALRELGSVLSDTPAP